MKKIILTIICLMLVATISSCNSASKLKKHEKKIEELVELRYFSENSKYKDYKYEIYPIYNENDELNYFLIEFEPDFFVYVRKNTIKMKILTGISDYTREEGEIWRHYKRVLRENGKKYESKYFGVEYSCSHFKAAGVLEEKLYILMVDCQEYGGLYIPAVKRGDKFLNLVSLEEFVYVKTVEKADYSWMEMGFSSKKYFDL